MIKYCISEFCDTKNMLCCLLLYGDKKLLKFEGWLQEELNPILHTAWLNNHALTLKSNTAKYYFGEKSSFLHTFLNFCCESRKI